MSIQGTVTKLVVGVAVMFFLAFGLVPLYDVICGITGLDGKTRGRYEYVEADLEKDEAREIGIRFVTNRNSGMPRGFGAEQVAMRVNPGGADEVMFHAHDPADRIMVAQTIPSVVPGRAGAFFHKTQCFCFDQQELMPGESVRTPVHLIVDRDLSRSAGSIILSCTMYDITDQAAGKLALKEFEAAGPGTAPVGGIGNTAGG